MEDLVADSRDAGEEEASMLAAWRTARAGNFVSRPWLLASATTDATASLITFLRRSLSRSAPPALIGVEAPMLVWGAISSTSAASEIHSPAEPARAPSGATYTITGIGEP